MKPIAAALLFLAFVACKDDPGGGELTGTSSPEAEARRATEQDTQVNPATDSALTGTFGGPTAGQAPGQPAESGYHQGATGTDATTLTDPNVSTTAAPTQTTT